MAAYNKDRNYAQELQDAMNSGASDSAVQDLLDARNNKISGSGNYYTDKGISSSDDISNAALEYITNKQNGSGKNESYYSDAANKIANSGSGGGKGGGFSYSTAPSYASRYQNQIDELTRDILGREAFSYDAESDPTYQQYKESYTRNGQRAMQDTLGQISARTGGLASSYAGTASQQTYDNYMSSLADKIPELRQLAYSMYQDEGNTQRANLEMLQALDQGDYNKYLTLLGQYNTDRNFNYQAGRDQISDQRYNTEWGYGVGRDQISDQRYGSETEWNRALQKAQTLGASGDFSGYKALGYSDAEISNLKATYDREQALALLTKRSGGSGGSSSSGGAEDYEGLYAAAAASPNPQNYIASHYKEFGLKSSSGLNSVFQTWNKNGGASPGLNYNQDDGIFTYNGKEYRNKDELIDAINKAGLTAAQEQEVLRKLDLFGFDFY